MRKTIRLPIRFSYGASGGAQFSTEIVTTVSGFEQRCVNWEMPRAKYNLSSAFETKEDIQLFINFFNAHKGKAFSFRFKDFCDFEVQNQCIGIGDGKNKNFKLFKTYAVGELSLDRVIAKPVEDSVKVSVDGKQVEFTCNYETGELILLEAPAPKALVLADFEFDVHVRFDTDKLELSPEPFSNYKDISIIEVV